MLRLFLIVGLFGLLFGSALAHDPAISGIRFIQRDSDFIVSVSIHLSRLQKIEGKTLSDAEIMSAIERRLRVRIAGEIYQPRNEHLIFDRLADMVSWQSVTPGHFQGVEVLARLVPEDPKAQTIVSFMQDGAESGTFLLDAEQPDLLLGSHRMTPLETTGAFFIKGVEHILSGPDHILFVVGLLLLGGGLGALLRTITAFTVAHSITLSLAATNTFNPPSRFVEPLIALSIVAIAVENLRSKKVTSAKRDFRPYVAFGFGLIHGFGFAGALSEAKIAPSVLPYALASFNIGVEAGQAFIVVLIAPLIAWAVRVNMARWNQVAMVCSVGIALIGSYWFIERVMGGG